MIKTCVDYHQVTSYDRFGMSGHSLDWANQPKVFKEYPGVVPLPLPRDLHLPKARLPSILERPASTRLSKPLDLPTLSLLLFLSNTHTAKARYPQGDFFFRSAASAGALYPTEIYLTTHRINGIDNGLYHFAIQNHSLDPLRKGDVFGPAQGEGARLTFFLTAIFFRSAWKYRARAYRYHLLDTGHVVENLILALKALHLPFTLTYDFDDGAVNRLLGVDDQREVTLAVIDVPGNNESLLENRDSFPSLPGPEPKAVPVSAKETHYPAVTEMHQAGIRICPGTTKEMVHQLGLAPESWVSSETPRSWPEVLDYPDAVFRRRSRRNFIRKPMEGEGVGALLRSMCGNERSPYEQSIGVGFLVGQAEAMEPGFYLLDRKEEAWALVSRGQFMAKSTSTCLDQEWLVNAGVHFLFLANLESLEGTWGPRGYRYAMLTAGRLGQRLYVAAEAMGMGCCGIGALYDGEAMDMLGLNQSSRLLYLVAVGNVKKS